MKKITLPDNVKLIIDRLTSSGYEAFAVGGCIRDEMFGLIPHDYDVTTSCLPKETKKVFSDFKIVETGMKHGTVTVIINGVPYEITTYRKDAEYSDHRHPDKVTYTERIIDDLSRRDFTINAMAYNDETGLVDPFGGLEDLNNGVIRCVGDPMKRFNEDALRILRCLRFASRFGFRIDSDTEKALFMLSDLLEYVSVERISVEFNEIICNQSAEEYLCKYNDVFTSCIPELVEADYTGLSKLADHLPLRLALLFARNRNGYDIADKMLHRLHYSNEIINEVRILITSQNMNFDDSDSIKVALTTTNKSTFIQLIQLNEVITGKDHSELLEWIDHIADILISRSDLKLSGDDLKEIGLTGKSIGIMLEKAFTEVLLGRLKNDKKTLMKYVKKEMTK